MLAFRFSLLLLLLLLLAVAVANERKLEPRTGGREVKGGVTQHTVSCELTNTTEHGPYGSVLLRQVAFFFSSLLLQARYRHGHSGSRIGISCSKQVVRWPALASGTPSERASERTS